MKYYLNKIVTRILILTVGSLLSVQVFADWKSSISVSNELVYGAYDQGMYFLPKGELTFSFEADKNWDQFENLYSGLSMIVTRAAVKKTSSSDYDNRITFHILGSPAFKKKAQRVYSSLIDKRKELGMTLNDGNLYFEMKYDLQVKKDTNGFDKEFKYSPYSMGARIFTILGFLAEDFNVPSRVLMKIFKSLNVEAMMKNVDAHLAVLKRKADKADSNQKILEESIQKAEAAERKEEEEEEEEEQRQLEAQRKIEDEEEKKSRHTAEHVAPETQEEEAPVSHSSSNSSVISSYPTVANASSSVNRSQVEDVRLRSLPIYQANNVTEEQVPKIIRVIREQGPYFERMFLMQDKNAITSAYQSGNLKLPYAMKTRILLLVGGGEALESVIVSDSPYNQAAAFMAMSPPAYDYLERMVKYSMAAYRIEIGKKQVVHLQTKKDLAQVKLQALRARMDELKAKTDDEKTKAKEIQASCAARVKELEADSQPIENRLQEINDAAEVQSKEFIYESYAASLGESQSTDTSKLSHGELTSLIRERDSLTQDVQGMKRDISDLARSGNTHGVIQVRDMRKEAEARIAEINKLLKENGF